MPTSSGKATAAMVLGVIGLLTSCAGVGIIIGIVALIVGVMAISEIDRSNGELTGRGKAQAGAILGGVSLLMIPILALMIGIMVPALGAARRAANKMKNGTQMTAMAKNTILWSDQFYQQDSEFPRAGLTPDPTTFGYPRGIPSNSVGDRLGALVNMGSDVLAPAMLVNPIGSDVAASGIIPNIVLQPHNVSYALLDAENVEWKNKVNASAPLGSDKQVRGGSFWNTKWWEGDVVWGDTHVTWETGQTSGAWPSTTIGGNTTANDDLFSGDTGKDAKDAVLMNP